MTEPTDGPSHSDELSPTLSAPSRIIEHLDSHALFELDPSGQVVSWPAPAKTLYGYNAAVVCGQPVSMLFADETAEAVPSLDILDEPMTTPTEIEHWHERADGSVFWSTLTLSPVTTESLDGYIAVSQDTTVQHEESQRLKRQHDRLKEFTDLLVHDLRNPVNAIQGHLSLYRETGENHHIRAVERTTDRMAQLIDDLLEIARQGGVVDQPEHTDIESVIRKAWEGTGTQAQATLTYHTVPPISADPDRLCELFANLFRNAIEHAGPDVAIQVGPLADGFYIADDGPGIPRHLCDDIFDHGVSTDVDGSGFGLSLVQTVVDAHGWEIAVTERYDGACFEITGITFLD